MASLIYSPAIKVHVATRNGILDISKDLVGGTLILRENAPHTFQFQLQNTQRKYDGQLLPMDKISIMLKRLTWLQAFTGYLNDSPIFQAWPGTLTIDATCTLKVPQFYYTDPTTSTFQSMVRTSMGVAEDGQAVQGDSGLSRLIVDSLGQVIGWDKSRVHIGQIPKNWFSFADKVATLIGKDEALYQTLGPGYTASGSYNGSSVVQPGKYSGGESINATQAKNLSTIIGTALSFQQTKTAPENLAVMAVMCTMVEGAPPGAYNYANSSVPESLSLPHDAVGSDHDSVGLFQQRPSSGWGTVKQCMDPVHATQTFVKRLVSVIPKAKKLSEDQFGVYVQTVQVSAFPTRYAAYLDFAKSVVAAAMAVNGSTPTIHGQADAPLPGYKTTGSQVGGVALGLIAARKKNPIHYQEGGDDSYKTAVDKLTKLDCSSLVDWVFYHSTGSTFGTMKSGRNNVASIDAACVKRISYEAAKGVQGCVLINPPNNHVAVSTGDGHCVAAKTDEAPLADQVVAGDPDDGQGFAYGGLLPGVDYSAAATTDAGLKGLAEAGIKTRGKAQPLTAIDDPTTANSVGSASTDPIENLINSVIVNSTEASQLVGEVLGGPVTLINDQPFLPWLQSVVNASMRSFCSAPNGDFIAWFPDYFGAWNTAGVVNIEQIELQNFQVTWSDQQIVTHQFVIGSIGATLLDPTSGSLSSSDVTADLVSLAQGTAGIASMDYPEIFKVIYGETVSTSWTHAFLNRFGARPDVQQIPNVPHGNAEFFMALYLFMQRWAAQFTAEIDLTFMPELFPGMLVRLPYYGIQAYVQGVTHSFSFGNGGGFTTSIDVCAPSNTGDASRTDLLALLPMAQTPAQPKSKKLVTKH